MNEERIQQPSSASRLRAIHADALITQAQKKHEQLCIHNFLAYECQINDARPLGLRAANIAKLLKEDSQREPPCIDLGFQFETGSLLLTTFVEFIAHCITLSETKGSNKQHQIVWKILRPLLPFISELISRPPTKHLRDHAEERHVLALLTSLAVPIEVQSSKSTVFALQIARSLIKRGADINGRLTNGRTPVQNWCCYPKITSATGLLLLLEAGADLDADALSNPTAWTALSLLCSFKCTQAIRELSAKGWLLMSNVEQAIRQLKNMQVKEPADVDVQHLLQLLLSEKKHWLHYGRAAVTALLSSLDQFVPDLTEIVVSYIDGGTSV
jgi:hypothetical protein